MTLDRRRFLAGTSASLAGVAQERERVRREVFLQSPRRRHGSDGFGYYTKAKDLDMLSIEQRWSRSDTIDVCYLRTSTDHGKSWSAPTERITGERRREGMLRRHLRGCSGWIQTGARPWNEGVLPTDDPLEGLWRWQIYYTVSRDGFATRSETRMVRQRGQPDQEPPPGVFPGKNSIMLGDPGSQPLAVEGGFLPCEITPLQRDGTLYNPGGGYTYHYSAVLHANSDGPR